MTIFDDIKKIKSTPKELKEFGMVMGIFFAILTGLFWWRHRNFLPYACLSAVFFILRFVMPAWLKPLQKIWMTFAVMMGFVMTRVILGILFFLVLTPVSFISRLTGKKFLDLDFKKPQDTYWNPYNKDNTGLKKHEVQY